jgi:hypothetical protein
VEEAGRVAERPEAKIETNVSSVAACEHHGTWVAAFQLT